jgi:ATP-binding cassette subfamily C protein CydCD
MYGLGVLAAAKAVTLVVIAGAVASGVTSVIQATGAWREAVVVGLLGAAARGLLTWVERVAQARAALGAKEALRARLADRLMEGGSPSAGAATALATRGLDDLDEYYSSVLPALTGAAVIPLVVGARILFADRISAVVILFTIPLVPLFMSLVGMYTKDAVAGATRALGRLSDHLVDLARGLPVLVGLGRVEEQSAALERVSDDYRAATMRTLRVAFLSSLVLELISTMSVAVVAVFIGLRLVNGSLPLETGLLVLILAPECFTPFRQLGAAFHASQSGVAALDAARALIDEPEHPRLGAAPAPVVPAGPAAGGNAAVRVANLTVSYGDRGRPAVDDLSFELAARRTAALVGESGSGKSTVIAVLAGRVRPGVDGTRVTGQVSGLSPERVAWVPQHPVAVADSVRQELEIYGDGIPKELLEARISELSRRFGLTRVLDDDPAQLSPGELRRVAFVRALLRVDAGADLLLLDEPTAHLDAGSAAAVRREIERLDGRITMLIASHEPELVDAAAHRIRVGMDVRRGAERADRSPVRVDRPAAHRTAPPAPHRVGTLAAIGMLAAFVRPARGRFAGAVLLSSAAALFSVSLTAVSGWLIVRASQEPNVMLLLVAIVGVRFFGIGRAALHYGEQLVTHDAVFTSIGSVRMRLWNALARRGPGLRRLLTGGTSIDYLVLTADRIRDLAPRVILPIGAGLLTALGALIAVFLLDPPATVVLAGCLALCLAVAPPLALAADRRAGREQARLRSRLGRRFASLVAAAADLRANGVDRPVRAELSRLDREAGGRARRAAWALGIGQAVVTASCCATAVAMLPVVLPAARAGTLPPEIVAVLALLPLGLIEPFLLLVGAVQSWPVLAQSLASADELDPPRERDAARASSAVPGIAPERIRGLRLTDLGARWPGAPEPVFSHVNAELGTGDWLVVSGPSGAGKSTLLSLLLGYLEPAAGRYELDGVDIRGYDPTALRRRFAWAPQEGHLFDSTIRGNLLLARPHDDRPSDDELREVLRRVGLGSLLGTLPAGLETRVGPHGSHLSGGQRQRLAVARTLLTRADVILLDEPTAHLDHEAADALLADLRAATEDKLTVLVTHRDQDARPWDVRVDLGDALRASAGDRDSGSGAAARA